MFDDPVQADQFGRCRPALQDIITEFQDSTPAERMDILVDFAEGLHDLPAWLAGRRAEMEQVHECQTAVFLYTTLEEGAVHFYFDIPRESPTVRGYAGILHEGLNGATPQEVLSTPDDLYRLLGLQEVISHLRLRGLHALLAHVKRQTAALASG